MFLIDFIPGYLGNKSKIISLISKEINKINKEGDTICDLFAGSGVVGDFLKKDYNIIANDIEFYSYIINKINLNIDIKEIKNIDIENIIHKLENDIFGTGLNINIGNDLLKYIEKLNKRKKVKELFFYSNFVGNYFSLNQGLEIDFYRLYIERNYTGFIKDYLIGLGIFGLYNIVNSVGNHFAQPRIIKEKNINIIKNKFSKSFYKVIQKKHSDIIENIENIKLYSQKNIVNNLDYKELLKKDYKIDTFYIDTPYTIDHYSRFYHILDTFSKYDYPEVEGVGLYRKDRFQSPFCIKTKVEKEFENMIGTIFNNYKANILLSYSDSYRSLLHKDKILELFRKYYKDVSVKEINYNYSGLGQSSGNKCNELLFIAKI